MTWWTAFEIAINLFQGTLMIFFMKRQSHLRINSRSMDLCFIAAIGFFQTLYLFFPIAIPDTVIFLLPFVYACIVSSDRWYVSFFWSIVLTALFIVTIGLIKNLYLQIPDVSWEMVLQASRLRMAFVVTCNIALLLIIFLTTRLMQQRETLSWLAVTVFALLIAVQLLTAELLFTISIHETQNDDLFIYVDLCLLISSVISLSLFEFLSATTEKRHRAESELRSLQASQHHAAELRGMYTAMLEQQHNLKHRIQSIEQMMAYGGNLPQQSIVKELKQLNAFGPEFITGCVAVDAMLTAKKNTMDQLQIVFNYSPYPLHELPISETSFCLILDNVLDNAIEASALCDIARRRIHLSFARSWDMFYLVCENNMNPSSVKTTGLRFVTSKEGLIHGYGIQSIRRIVNQAQGRCKFVPSSNVFRVEIMLPYTKKEYNNEKNSRNTLSASI